MNDDIQKITSEAIDKGYRGANLDWRDLALSCVREVCMHCETFTMNDVRPHIEALPIKTHDNRAVAGVVKTAEKLGWIRPTGRTITSRVGHKSPLIVWKSLIYKPKGTLF